MKVTKYLVLLLFLTCLHVSAMNKEEPNQKNTQSQSGSTKMNSTEPSMKSQSAGSAQTCCPIVELRQYNLQPGKRDVLIDLFDREFVESQEALGMRIIGQFQDLDNANRFVWLRGFPDMTTRAQALTAFYGGPVWKANRNEANATMVDVNNVLLLRPALPTSGFMLENINRHAVGTNKTPKGLVVATIYYLDAPADADFVDFFERTAKPVLADAGASILAYFVTESSANNFPALPVREGEHVFVWFSGFQDDIEYEHYVAALAQSPRWRDEISKVIAGHIQQAPEVLRLRPTPRSLLQKRF
jgi:NIPSNAP